MTSPNPAGGSQKFWDFSKPHAWVAALTMGGLGLLVSKGVLAYLDQIVRYINSIAWNSVAAIPPIAILALLFACVRSEVVRTAVSNYFKIGTIAFAKALVRTNPVGWLKARALEFDELIQNLEKIVQDFRGTIGTLTHELKTNKGKIGQVMERNESAGEQQAELEAMFKDAEFEIDPDQFDVEKLDEYEQMLAARNASSMAATEAVSLEDRNRELKELIQDLVIIWKFMTETMADARLIRRKLDNEMKTVETQWKTSQSVWSLLRAAQKFQGSAVQQMLDSYAKQYVNENYASAIAQFKHFRTQGSQLLADAMLDRRTASRKAKDMLTEYRRAKAVKATPGAPDVRVNAATPATVAGVRVQQ